MACATTLKSPSFSCNYAVNPIVGTHVTQHGADVGEQWSSPGRAACCRNANQKKHSITLQSRGHQSRIGSSQAFASQANQNGQCQLSVLRRSSINHRCERAFGRCFKTAASSHEDVSTSGYDDSCSKSEALLRSDPSVASGSNSFYPFNFGATPPTSPESHHSRETSGLDLGRRSVVGFLSLALMSLVQLSVQNHGEQQTRLEDGSLVIRNGGLSGVGIGVGASLAEEKKAPRKRDEYDEAKLLEQNRRIQSLNSAPENFPGFIREGFEVKVVTGPEYEISPSGLIYLDIVTGEGGTPTDGQQVTFHYIGYNESARRVDSTYLRGSPAQTRVGIGGLIPGFEEGIKTMHVGGRRRIVIPPELGPPTGPSTFFSAKQYEVFDVELLAAKDCVRRQVVFYSDVVCE
eukprot:TRINITY_DN21641_c0_g1_i1.p1 TRINITY_DN21641_c0_g1~~TRINITY_DN21641_c0_g1_i1.p1  ORF type:complete len:404 (+),score=48.79 TRINITY_DN21641_c0_g1_i1:115-1326(+)